MSGEMKGIWRLTGFVIAAIILLPSAFAAGTAPEQGRNPDGGAVSSKLLRVTNEMWLLLSGVMNKETADRAAEKFSRLVEQSAELSNAMFDADAQALDVEALDNEDTYRIAEAYEELSSEFTSLCRARCYGSAGLTRAFTKAIREGIFSDEDEVYLHTTTLVLTSSAAVIEIRRLRALRKPDDQLLSLLVMVKDAPTATRIAPQLHRLAKKMSDAQPELRLCAFNFPDNQREELLGVCRELETVLWKIRNEIVRIVGLPGYDSEQFDTFSDALDDVYESLSCTHAECFDDVFDASFRTDLDDALHEGVGLTLPQ